MPRAQRYTPAVALVSLAMFTSLPAPALACARCCGMFYVGDGALVPNVAGSGFTAWFRYSYMDQNQNWEGSHSGPASDNSDKQLQTSFFTFGGDYMINRHWTAMAELPIYDRAVTSIDDGTVFGAAGSI